MKVFKKVKYTVDRLSYTKTICDKCGKEVKKDSRCDEFNCILSLREGKAYPEGDFSTIKTIDLCQECGNNLFNLLEKEGYKVQQCNYEDYIERCVI